mmetsp:Transcript_20323/g.29770  ORF Transcript_20323/g.29770 Transcript_20323/m.29770 type:complete len:130 (+) Transcript_20323:1215-1604(+)
MMKNVFLWMTTMLMKMARQKMELEMTGSRQGIPVVVQALELEEEAAVEGNGTKAVPAVEDEVQAEEVGGELELMVQVNLHTEREIKEMHRVAQKVEVVDAPRVPVVFLDEGGLLVLLPIELRDQKLGWK